MAQYSVLGESVLLPEEPFGTERADQQGEDPPPVPQVRVVTGNAGTCGILMQLRSRAQVPGNFACSGR